MTTINNKPAEYLEQQLQGLNLPKLLVVGVDVPFPSKKELTQEEIIMALGVEMPSSPAADRKNNQIAAEEILFSPEYQMEKALDWVREFNGSDPIPNIREFTGNERDEPTKTELKKAFSELNVFLSDKPTGKGLGSKTPKQGR